MVSKGWRLITYASQFRNDSRQAVNVTLAGDSFSRAISNRAEPFADSSTPMGIESGGLAQDLVRLI